MDTTVQTAQRRLLALGYDLGNAGADGIAGRMTIAAITKYQTDKHLKTTYPGTLDAVTLAALGVGATGSTPPWVSLARTKMGLNEIKDKKALTAFLASDGHALGDPSKLPWCGDFVETCIAVSLPREPMIANPYWALNWLSFGVVVNPAKPVFGAIGVKSRDGGGHVFFIVGHDKDYWHALGGNQSNSVSIVKIAKGPDIKGLRYPSTYPLPASAMPYSVFNGNLAGSEA